MKELDGLREALGDGINPPWEEDGLNLPWEEDGVHLWSGVERIAELWGTPGMRRGNGKAIVLSVNLAPHLLRVAEAADAFMSDQSDPEKAVALDDAIVALKEAATIQRGARE